MKKFFASLLFWPLAAFATDTNDLPPLLPAYPEIQPTFWEQYRVLVLIGGFVALLVLSPVIWLLLRPKPAVALSPAQVAREALKKLERQPEDGKLLSAVSQIFRRYVGAVFGFDAVQMTTTEFSRAIAAHPQAGPQMAEVFVVFLQGGDKVKFTAPDNTHPRVDAVRRALDLIQLIESGWRETPAEKFLPQ